MVVAVAEATNAAVTDRDALIGTEQAPVPEQAPLQPAKVEPAAAEATSLTFVKLVPNAYCSLQSLPQSMPGGEDVTVPLPVPDLLTSRVGVAS